MIFFIICFLELLGELFNIDYLIFYCKPFLMPTLYFQHVLFPAYIKHNNFTLIDNLKIVGLLSATLGDMLLLFKNNTVCFIFGIISFGITQVSYSIIYYTNIGSYVNIIFIVPLYFFVKYFYNIILREITNKVLKFFVASYIFLIALVIYGSVLYNNLYVILGTSLFVFSDILIGLNIGIAYYYQNIYNFLIMSSYIIGQYLIITNI